MISFAKKRSDLVTLEHKNLIGQISNWRPFRLGWVHLGLSIEAQVFVIQKP